MERLTKRNESNTAYYYPKCFEKCDGLGTSVACNRCELQHDMCEKLGHYEDLEEQGLLLKLPCKVGDTVYEITGATVRGYDWKYLTYENAYIHETVFSLYRIYDIGKTVFLTREEAEEALMKAGGKDE